MTTMNLLDFASVATPTRELPAVADGRAIDLPLGSELRVASKQSARFGDGGDFFEVFEHASRTVSTVVADVCGNGAAAAKVAARIRPFLHHSLARGESPGRVLAALNDPLGEAGFARLLERAPRVTLDLCETLLLDGAPTRDDATVLVLQLPARAATPLAA